MSRAAFLRRMLNRYGCEVTVLKKSAPPVTVRALVQDINRKNRQYSGNVWLPEGCYDKTYSYYIGPPDCRLDAMGGATIACMGRRYEIVRTQDFAAQDEVLYVWAVLRELPGEESNDGI